MEIFFDNIYITRKWQNLANCKEFIARKII